MLVGSTSPETSLLLAFNLSGTMFIISSELYSTLFLDYNLLDVLFVLLNVMLVTFPGHLALFDSISGFIEIIALEFLNSGSIDSRLVDNSIILFRIETFQLLLSDLIIDELIDLDTRR